MSEDQNIEYKQSWRDEYLKWICGFANAKKNVGVNVAKNAKKLLELIAKNSNISAVTASEKLNISKRQVERLFAELKANNLVKRVGSDKTGYWEIVDSTESDK